MNTAKRLFSYFKEFLSTLKPHVPYFLIASFTFFISVTVTNPILFKMFFPSLHVTDFLKEHSLIVNLVSLTGQLVFTACVFYYYYKVFANGNPVKSVKVFVASSIAANLFFITVTFVPAIAVYVLNVLFGVKNMESVVISVVTVLAVSASYAIYVIPYFYGKALTESEGIKDALKTFLSALRFKNYFRFIKDGLYFKTVFETSFFTGVVMTLFFIPVIISYIGMVSTSDPSVFKIMFILNNVLTAVAYVFVSYAMIFISVKTYKEYVKEKSATQKTTDSVKKKENETDEQAPVLEIENDKNDKKETE